MKDEKGHGSNARGESGVGQAAQAFVAAHQNGVSMAVPSQSGRDLYNAVQASGQGDSGAGWDAKAIADMAPDFDEMPGVGPDPWYPDPKRR